MDNSAQTEVKEITVLREKLKNSLLPPDLLEKTQGMVERASLGFKMGGYFTGLDQVANYLDWITNLPWNKRSEDNLDLAHAKEVLEQNHYGLTELKERILEYISVMKLRKDKGENIQASDTVLKFMRAPILCFVGLVGTGKTTIAYSIAEAMGRKFVRIPFGGMGSALDLRGQSRVHPDAEVGQLIKALRRAGTKNPVILLDELDRVSAEARADIMGVLVELLDPEQNTAFVDHYIDYPFDLSEALFIATANNTGNIATAVLDRLEPIQMPSYNDDEKTIIGKKYVYPKMVKETGLTTENLQIDDEVWSSIVRPLGFDSGIRTLERTINGVCRKIAKEIVEGKGTSFHLTPANIKEYLPKW
ncbi:MAG: Lon protease [Candidatus Gottesmanbacteria bacterium GW2011_GWA2_41_12]|uniref:Lon protease n=1 Tax=Candidatus Gottesmanbacteria bacterium GW2011_GWA2_41_12 TaxID=1618440 RepID=A0A0G0XLH2_9BACT|nr:MAG: Lon protease [Candidatus Gottesmanbacteria bacterium GW2011_GWA2_41_12]